MAKRRSQDVSPTTDAGEALPGGKEKMPKSELGAKTHKQDLIPSPNTEPQIGSELREMIRQTLIELIREEGDEIRQILLQQKESPSEASTSANALSPKIIARIREEQGVELRGGDSANDDAAWFGICELYNNALSNQDDRSQLRASYEPIVISVINAVERRRNEKLPPVFQTATAGNFLAIRLPLSDEFAVFPKFSLIVQESSFGPGAVGEVFDCAGFDPRLNYPNIRVRRPAIFESGNENDWKLRTPGALDLGQGQEP